MQFEKMSRGTRWFGKACVDAVDRVVLMSPSVLV